MTQQLLGLLLLLTISFTTNALDEDEVCKSAINQAQKYSMVGIQEFQGSATKILIVEGLMDRGNTTLAKAILLEAEKNIEDSKQNLKLALVRFDNAENVCESEESDSIDAFKSIVKVKINQIGELEKRIDLLNNELTLVKNN
jgi:hypothetical protein